MTETLVLDRDAILFEDKENTKEISLKELKKTQSLSEYSGRLPNSRPLEAFALIEGVMEKCDKYNLHPSLEQIWVSKSDSKRIKVLDPDNVGSLQSWLFQRLVTRIHLNSSLSNEDNNSSIAIGYNTHGIQVAFGTNVRVCSNMSIFGNQLIATYSVGKKDKTPFEQFFNILEGWMQKAGEIRERDLGIFKLMEEYEMPANAMENMIGKLQMKAVEANYIDATTIAPLNIGQVSTFSKNYLMRDNKSDPYNLFQAYNCGTALLKAKTTDISTIWPDVLSLGNFCAKEYLNLN